MKNYRFNWLAPAAAFVAGAVCGWKVGYALNSVVVNGRGILVWAGRPSPVVLALVGANVACVSVLLIRSIR